MADARLRNPADQGGGWFVDTTCFDCDVARQLAPGLIEEDADGLSFFVREPRTPEEVLAAWRALLACPTGSIGAPRGAKPPENTFPMRIAPGVELVGFHSKDSFGAHAYRLDTSNGPVLVDAPRYTDRLARAFAERGGIRDILLTHRDDVADSARYAREFGARVWIHRDDAKAASHATDVFDQEQRVRPDLIALPFPGHTRGSAVFLWQDKFLFTGDSLAFSRRTRDLTAFRDATWYSWSVLQNSIAMLRGRRFEWVFPGHGSWGHDSESGMQRRVGSLLGRMAAGPRPPNA